MKEKILKRLRARKEVIDHWFTKLERQIESGVIGGEPGRLWLDQFAQGEGFNIACGDFTIGNAIGVDLDPKKIAIDFWGFGDVLPDPGDADADFIVTNYLECWPQTHNILKEWAHTLRVKGVLAIVFCDADTYLSELGPLTNHRRITCFTVKTLTAHMTKAGFKVFKTETIEEHIKGLAAWKI